jgi:hypothetical protein
MPTLEASQGIADSPAPADWAREAALQQARAAAAACVEQTKIDPWNELLIVEPADLVPGNQDTPWAFASVMRSVAGALAGSVANDWLRALDKEEYGAAQPDATLRSSIESAVLCPWKRAYEGNECDATCAHCKYETLRLRDAPFVPIAVVNRGDLAANASGCTAGRGEARIVYNAIDLETRVPLPLTVSFEFGFGDAKVRVHEWHALGAQVDPQNGRSGLEAVVAKFVSTDNLLRVRTGESIRSLNKGAWHMRDFAWRGDRLQPQALAETPPNELWNTQELSLLMAGRNALSNNIPSNQLAWVSVIPTPAFTWVAPLQSPRVERSFSQITCNGCHGGDRPYDGLTFRHIMLDDEGQTRVSRFLFDPDDRNTGELARRAKWMRESLCGVCSTGAGGYYAP